MTAINVQIIAVAHLFLLSIKMVVLLQKIIARS